jgi:hypothetical protein
VASQPYRLVVADLRSDRVMDVLPVQGVTFDDYIGKTGSFSATVPLPSRDLAQRAKACLLPGRTMLYLERAGQIAWAGPLWTRTPTMDDRGFESCPIQAGGLEGLFRSHRLLVDTLALAGVDQLDIVRQLIAYCQAQTGGNLGIEIDYSQLSGVLRDRTYSRYDLPWIGSLIDQLAAVDGGFEWRIQCFKDSSGARHRALRLGYPKLTAGTQDVQLSSPGTIASYSLPEDATVQANAWQSRGATNNSSQSSGSVPLMSALLTSPADYTAGWPRLDGSSDYTDVSDQATLDSHAAADLARWRSPVVIPSVKVRTAGVDQPVLGSYVRLKIINFWNPAPGLLARYRVVGLRVEPEERGRAETTELYLEAA